MSEQNRLEWACRRGMLELDLLLGPFAVEEYPHLSTEKQALFRELLTCDDTDLWEWFSYQTKAPLAFVDLINAIVAASVARMNVLHDID